MLMRAARLSSASTTYQGTSGMSVRPSISSLAWEYTSQRVMDSRSIAEILEPHQLDPRWRSSCL